MNDEDEITPSLSRSKTEREEQQAAGTEELEAQLSALTEVVGGLAGKLNHLRDRLTAVETGSTGDPSTESEGVTEPGEEHDQPAAWVMFTPPAAAEDHQHRHDEQDPSWTLDNFVAWYNTTYVGIAGGPAPPIPTCWRCHPGLAMEVATLAYTWRRANIGATANVRDAQHWHHQWRSGFTARLSEWVHPHCLDGRHREVGSTARTDRFGHHPDTSHLLPGRHLDQRSA